MQRNDTVTGPILRVFEARAKVGRADELQHKLATTSIGVVQDRPGNQGYFFGRGVAGDADVVVFVSIWKDLDAVKARFGEDWERSFLPEGYADLIVECSVRHLDLVSGWQLTDLAAR